MQDSKFFVTIFFEFDAFILFNLRMYAAESHVKYVLLTVFKNLNKNSKISVKKYFLTLMLSCVSNCANYT